MHVTISGRMMAWFPLSSYTIIIPVSGPRVRAATAPPMPTMA